MANPEEKRRRTFPSDSWTFGTTGWMSVKTKLLSLLPWLTATALQKQALEIGRFSLNKQQQKYANEVSLTKNSHYKEKNQVTQTCFLKLK